MLASTALKIKRLRILRFLVVLFLLAGVASALSSCSWGVTKKDEDSTTSEGATGTVEKTVDNLPEIVNALTNLVWTGVVALLLITFAFPQTRAAVRFLIVAVYAWMTQWFHSRTKDELKPPPPGGTS